MFIVDLKLQIVGQSTHIFEQKNSIVTEIMKNVLMFANKMFKKKQNIFLLN